MLQLFIFKGVNTIPGRLAEAKDVEEVLTMGKFLTIEF